MHEVATAKIHSTIYPRDSFHYGLTGNNRLENLSSMLPGSKMTISRVLSGVTVSKMFQTMFGKMVVTHDVEIGRVQYNSRNVGRSDIFVAIQGNGVDGNKYIPDAIANGAKAVVTDNDGSYPDSYFMHTGVVKVVVPDARIALAQMSANYFDRPASSLKIIGVTGTNGKTTTAFLLHHLVNTASYPAGLIGTIEYRFGSESIPASHTTPESLELHGIFAKMRDGGCKSAVMEVSSHALHQRRVYGIDFQAAVFTNLTQDHLDYHKTMEEYFSAKKMLFDSLSESSLSVINTDDSWGNKLFNGIQSRKISYGIRERADIRGKDIELSFAGTTFTIEFDGKKIEINSRLVGQFNVHNLLSAFATGYGLGFSTTSMAEVFQSVKPVSGRFEQIQSPKGWTAIVDYAHTPDALEKTLKTIHDIMEVQKKDKVGKIITVFGCGGNRDALKRPVMGKIASELSDSVIVTSDNPRHESPEIIIENILEGIAPGSKVCREPDRKKAIVAALQLAEANDVVLIAGKGHEDYQILGNEKIWFSDQSEVQNFIGNAG